MYACTVLAASADTQMATADAQLTLLLFNGQQHFRVRLSGVQ